MFRAIDDEDDDEEEEVGWKKNRLILTWYPDRERQKNIMRGCERRRRTSDR